MKHEVSDIRQLYATPFTSLIFRALQVHHQHHDADAVQLCTLKSIKTGACPEDCKYCPQSAHYNTTLTNEPLLETAMVLPAAQAAKCAGASRFCMGAAWREVRDGHEFDSALKTVSAVAALGLEVCCTFGMLSESQARRLREAGCSVYNHNLDTSRHYYSKIITTRSYQDRLQTMENVRKAGMELCCGGILGMGESVEDRIQLLCELANLHPQPESVPINALVPVEGTPLENQEPVEPFEFVRVIAVARILMPQSMVRLSAGRNAMSEQTQALCFLAGANSIFLGEKLLTTPNPQPTQDLDLLKKLGLHAMGEADRAQRAKCEERRA